MLVTDFVELLLRFECRAPLSLAWTSWLERAGEPTAQCRVPGAFTLMEGVLQPGHNVRSAGTWTQAALGLTLLQCRTACSKFPSKQQHRQPAPFQLHVRQRCSHGAATNTAGLCPELELNSMHCRGINKEARNKMQGGHNIFSNDVESRPAGKAGVKVRGHRVPEMHLSIILMSAAHDLPAPTCFGIQRLVSCLHLHAFQRFSRSCPACTCGIKQQGT